MVDGGRRLSCWSGRVLLRPVQRRTRAPGARNARSRIIRRAKLPGGRVERAKCFCRGRRCVGRPGAARSCRALARRSSSRRENLRAGEASGAWERASAVGGWGDAGEGAVRSTARRHGGSSGALAGGAAAALVGAALAANTSSPFELADQTTVLTALWALAQGTAQRSLWATDDGT